MSFNSMTQLATNPNVASHLLFQDTSGTTVVDSSGAGIHGTTVNMGADPTLTTTPYNWLPSAFQFNGVNESVYLGAALASLPETYDMTILMRIRADTATGQRGVFCFSGIDDLILYANDSNSGSGGYRVFWRDLGGTLISEAGPDLTGAWHDLAFVTRASDSHEIYRDGVSIGSSSGTGIAGPFNSAAIGYFPGQFFLGAIADVLILKEAISLAEIQEWRSGPEPLSITPTVITGDTTIGSTLTTSGGTWAAKINGVTVDNGTINLTRQWYRADDDSGTNATAISGATAVTYDLVEADLGKHLAVLEAASNDGGNAPEEDTLSDWTAAITSGVMVTPPTHQARMLFANSTDSPDIFPTAGADGTLVFWFYLDGSPSADTLIANYYHDVARSMLQLRIKTDGKLQIRMMNDTDSERYRVSPVLESGWHYFLMTDTSADIVRYYVDDAFVANVAVSEKWTTSPNRIELGATITASDEMNFGIAGYAVASSVISTGNRAILYAGGVTPERDANVAVPGFWDFSCPLANTVTPTVGGVSFGCGITPAFADDNGFFTGAWTQSAFDAMPISRNGNVIPDDANIDVLMFGDSFVGRDLPHRLGSQFINELLRATNGQVRKLQNGLAVHNEAITLAVADLNTMTGGAFYRIQAANGGYQIGRDTSSPTTYMALPTHGIYEYWHGTDAAGSYCDIVLQNAASAGGGPLESWIDSGTEIDVALVVWASLADQVSSVRVRDNGGPATDLTGMDGLTAGKMHKLAATRLSDNTADKVRTLEVQPGGGVFADDKILDLAGYHAKVVGRTKGMGYSALADDSWSLLGSGVNQSSTSTLDKRFSRDELKGWLASYVETGRKNLVVLQFAGEPLTQSTMQSQLEDIIANTDAAYTELGFSAPDYLILTAYVHSTYADDSAYAHRQRAEWMSLAADAIAQANSRVGHCSIHKLFGGCYFHDGANASLGINDADGPQQAWLDAYDAANGTSYASSPGRVAQDAADTHPANRASAEMFMIEVIHELEPSFFEVPEDTTNYATFAPLYQHLLSC